MAFNIRYPVSGIQYHASSIRLSMITIFIMLFTFLTFPQSKYFIYFKDKGITPSQLLGKQNFSEGERHLSKRSIERRKKSMGESFIAYEDLPLRNEYIDQLKVYGIEIRRKLKWFNAVSAYLTEAQVEQISSFSFVKKIVPVKTLSYKNDAAKSFDESIINRNYLDKNATVNGLNYGQSFDQLNLIDIPVVHSRGITGENVLVGFLDSGFDWREHEALTNCKIIGEYDFVFNDSITANQPGDSPSQHNHGTEVFSTCGGFKDSVLIGAAYGSSFVLAKTEDIRSESRIEEDNYAAALEWMDSAGVDITSSSLGYNQFDDTTTSYTYTDMDGMTTVVTKAAEFAFSRGIVTITAAGNEGKTKWGFIIAPADGFNTIAVGAVSNGNTVESFSSHGPTSDGRIKPEVVAQGSGNYAALPSSNSYTHNFGGTSAATPLVSGVASLLLSAHPHLKNTQVRSILLETADSTESPNNQRGYGLVSAARAVNFPNLEISVSQNILHKIFIYYPNINPSSVKIFFFTGDRNVIDGNLNYDGKLTYKFDFPAFGNGQLVFFHFTFSDSSGLNYRDPASGEYQFKYGLPEISTGNKELPPSAYALEQNYPNPFPVPSNPSTTILFTVPEAGNVTLKIYDILGNEIKTVLNERKSAGRYTVIFNSAGLASGVYIYQLKTGTFISSKKMIVLK